MSSYVFVKVKMRVVGARLFVREFKKEYGAGLLFTNGNCHNCSQITKANPGEFEQEAENVE